MTTAIDSEFDIPKENEFKKAMDRISQEMKRYKAITAEEEALIMPSQAAAMIGISPQAMERKINDGSIRSFTVMGKVWVSGKQIEEIMLERVKKLIDAGEDKNKIEASMYKKMYLNAKALKKQRKSKD